MRLLFAYIVVLLVGFVPLMGQDIDEEIGFKYVKAEYLFKTDRMEDAVRELNDIIKSNPAYKDALMLRAETRYRLAAYKGAKEDILKSIEVQGITLRATELLAKTDLGLNLTDAALNSLSAAIAMDTEDERIYELRAKLYEEREMLIKACEDYETAAKMGSTNAAIKVRQLCGKKYKIEPPKTPTTEPDSSEEDDTTETNNNESDNIDTNSQTTESSETDDTTEETNTTGSYEEIPVEDVINIPAEDNTPNEVLIDEDLSLTIYGQGLGVRKILDKPSILILSDQTGVVAVEVCINENGKVDYAEYNQGKSTISNNSLVSLAIRKSKEFWFEKSDYKKMCGFILFNIKGSE